MIRVAPSILDVSEDVNAYLKKIRNADAVHIDIIDGKFVRGKRPGRNMWANDVKKLRTTLTKHVHLMIQNPERHVTRFIKAGADVISFHLEATRHPKKVIETIRKHKKKVCLAMNPETSIAKIKPYLKDIDQLLIMSVHPGKGGQRFLRSVLPKIKKLRKIFKGPIEVDGGINVQTGRLAVRAGASHLVSGVHILHHPNPRKAVEELRRIR